jgi:hypothetical protein
MARAVPKPIRSHSLVRNPSPLAHLVAATFPQYLPFASLHFWLSQLSPVASQQLFLRSTLAQVYSRSSLMPSTSPPQQGINGELRKAHCTCSLFSVAGLAPWLHSGCFVTSQRRLRFRLPFGPRLCSIAQHSAGCFPLSAPERFSLCLVPHEG